MPMLASLAACPGVREGVSSIYLAAIGKTKRVRLMEVGTGIFLSAALLGAVALFIATKDRWNWKKILLWTGGILLVIPAIGGLATYTYMLYEDRPKLQTEFYGLKLGEKFQDVVFRHGKIERETTQHIKKIEKALTERKAEKGTAKYSELQNLYESLKKEEADETSKGSNDGVYVILDKRVTISNGEIESIILDCTMDSLYRPKINGIGCGDTSEEITSKFDRNLRVLCSNVSDNDNSKHAQRVYDVVKYGTRYYLYQNKVNYILLTSPSTLESYFGINWVKCN
jgi:hypothetical protein